MSFNDEFVLRIVRSCTVCTAPFNDTDNCPRIFTCEHSFCFSCIQQFFLFPEDRRTCPCCKTPIFYSCAQNVPINISLRDLAMSLTDSVGQKKMIKLKSKDKDCCKKHGNPKEFKCLDCKIWICGTCAVFEHSECADIISGKATKKKKDTKDGQDVTEELKAWNSGAKILKEAVGLLQVEIMKRKAEIVINETDLQKREKILEILSCRVRKVEAIGCKLNDLEKKIDNCKGIKRVKNVMKEVESLLREAKTQEEGQPCVLLLILPITLEGLQRLSKLKPVYVIDEARLKPLYGKVEVKNNKIWINSFIPEKPEIAQIVTLNAFLASYTRSSVLPTRTFLQLHFGESDLEGTVTEIVTDGVSIRALEFALHCSGLTGRSYKGVSMSTVLNDNFQSFLLNEKSPPVVDVIVDLDPKVPVSEGLVWGMKDELYSFGIALERKPEIFKNKIGTAVSGLKEWRRCLYDGMSVEIKECGLVIPYIYTLN